MPMPQQFSIRLLLGYSQLSRIVGRGWLLSGCSVPRTFPRLCILPRPATGHDKDDDHYDERRAEQQQLVENASFTVQQRIENG
jgi:hypothetical protein